MPGKPSTFSELFQFYHKYVKLLYSEMQTSNKLPDATLFEINAAFDHVSRHWTYSDSEGEAVRQATSHLKRSCLDIFRLKAKQARDQYDELRAIDTSIIDNGQFDMRLNQLMADIKRTATHARQQEGKSIDDVDNAFASWEGVYELCERMQTEFFLHPHLEWARKKHVGYSRKTLLISIAVSWVVGIFTPTIGSVIAFLKTAWHFVAK